MSVIGIVNPAPGCGKTTTAVNLAAGFARRGWRVLLVDLDPAASATAGLGLDPEGLTTSAYDALFGPRSSLPEAVVQTPFSSLSILPANANLATAESRPSPAGGRQETVLHLQLSTARDDYDFIVVDSPSTGGLLTANAIVASDQLIVPVACGSAVPGGLAELMELINRLMAQGNPITGRIDWLWTFYEPGAGASLEAWEEARAQANAHAFKARIRRDEAVKEAGAAREPVFYCRPDAPGTQDYVDLVAEVLEENDLAGAPPAAVPGVEATSSANASQALSEPTDELSASGRPAADAGDSGSGEATEAPTAPGSAAVAVAGATDRPESGTEAGTELGTEAGTDARPASPVIPLRIVPAAPPAAAMSAEPAVLPATPPSTRADAPAPAAGDRSPQAEAAGPVVSVGGGAVPAAPGARAARPAAPVVPAGPVLAGAPPTPLPARPPARVFDLDFGRTPAAGPPATHGSLVAGLDLGAASMQVVHLRVGPRRTPVLAGFAIERLPEAVEEEQEGAYARTLRALARRLRPQVTRVHANVSGNAVVVKPLTRPTVGEKEVTEALRWQHLAKGLPFAPDNALIGYCSKRVDGDDVGGRQKIFASAADPHAVELRTAAIQRAGLAVLSVTPDVFALESLVRRSGLAGERQAVAVLNVGLSATVLGVFAASGLEFCRDITIGAKDLLSLDEAEPAAPEAAPAVEGPTAAAAEGRSAAEKKSTKRFVSEILMSLEYYHQSVRSARVERVYLCGIRSVEILDFLPEDIHVELLDPWHNIEVPQELRHEAKVLGPSLAVAVGLALQETPRIDFLSSRGRFVNRLASLNRILSLVGVAVCLMVLLGWWNKRTQNDEMAKLLAAGRKEDTRLEEPLGRVREFNLLVARLRAARDAVRAIVPPPVRFYGILADLSQVLAHPRTKGKVYLQKVAYPPIQKDAPATAERPRDLIDFHLLVAVETVVEFAQIRAALLELFAQSPYLTDVSPEGSGDAPAYGEPYSLKITCRLRTCN